MKIISRIKKYSGLIFSISLVLVFLFCAFSYNYISSKKINSNNVYISSWTVKDTGEKFTSFNSELDANNLTITSTIKRFDNKSYALGISNYYAAFEVKLDDEVIYNYGKEKNLRNFDRLGNLYSIIDLDLKGKTPHNIEINYSSNSHLTIYDIDVGSNRQLYNQQFKEYLLVLLLVISVIFILIFIVISFLKKDNRKYFSVVEFWLSEFLITSSLWTIFDSQILQFIGVPAGLVCQLSMVVYGIFPMTLLLFVYNASKKLKKTTYALLIASNINLLVVVCMDLFNVKQLIDNLSTMHICTGLILALSLIHVSLNFKDKHTLSSLYLLMGYCSFSILSVIQYVYFFINPTKSNSNIMIVGLFIFYIFILCRFVRMMNLERTKNSLNYIKIIEEKNKELEDKNEMLYKAFGRFVPDSNINELITKSDNNAIKGSRINLTILQCDIRGFSDLIRPMDANGLVEMLNNYFDTVAGIIQKYNGTVISYIGDAILAAFGTDVSNKNHASQAIAAALEIQKEMTRVNHYNKLHDYPTLEIGIGINTGKTIIGYIGSEKHMKFDILGSPVNVCSRIESYSTGGQIIISQNTLEQARNVDIFENYTVFPKGSKEPIIIYSVCGIGAPYNVAYDVKYVNPVQLDAPIEIEFSNIVDKHVQDEKCKAFVVKASDNSMLLKTDERLNLFENIQINAYISIYGKVIAKEIGGYLIRISTQYDLEKLKR